MNNAYQIRASYTGRAEKCGRRRAKTEKTSPAWLVTLCRIILWFTRDDVTEMIRAVAGLCAVGAFVFAAGAIAAGSVPFASGAAVCAVFGLIAFELTGE